jgi:predicted metal-dependent hydrolase
MTRFHNINGNKVQFTEAEEAARDAEEQAWADGALDRALELLRKKRNNLLSETDWMANSDLTMSDAWKTYRQELRNLTNGLTTVEAVENVTYPTKPGE